MITIIAIKWIKHEHFCPCSWAVKLSTLTEHTSSLLLFLFSIWELVPASLVFVPCFHCSLFLFLHPNTPSHISDAESSGTELFSTSGKGLGKKNKKRESQILVYTSISARKETWIEWYILTPHFWMAPGFCWGINILEVRPRKERSRSIRGTEPCTPDSIITIHSPVLVLMDDHSLNPPSLSQL